MYKIDPASYSGIFVMPSEIIDKHLKLASEAMLKVILYVYRHADTAIDAADVAAGTGLSADDAQDGLDYWCAQGVLTDAEALAAPAAEPAAAAPDTTAPDSPAETKPAARIVVKPKPGKLSYQQICSRIAESPEVGYLFRESQEKLGRTISTADQSALLTLHDYYGLPVEVILAICEYANTHGKSNNINYIFTVGSDWSTREIDTLEAADEEFKKLEQLNALWPEFSRAAGIRAKHPTTSQQKYFDIWTGEWKFGVNMLIAAYEEMSRHTESTSFPYMNKILAAWHSAEVKTPEDAAEYQKKYELERARKELKKTDKKSPYGVRTQSDGNSQPASYDIDKATEYMNTTVPQHRKKEKR